MAHRKVIQEVYESGVLHDMLGVPRPQTPQQPQTPQPETNGVAKFDVSEVYPQEDGPGMDLADYSGSEGYRHESDENGQDEESRYRMRSSRPPPAKRRKPEPYHEYVTDDDESVG